jgi:hypothetical protein
MQESGWYYAVNGQRQGPIGFEQLRHMVAMGQIAGGDLVWHEGMGDWQAVSSIPALMPRPQPVYPQPAPPPQYQGYSAMPVGYQSQMSGGKSYQGMAIAGFVLSLLVIFPCTILGLIFSLVALNGMKTSTNQDGKGLATAGAVISIIFLSLACLYFIGIASCLTHF